MTRRKSAPNRFAATGQGPSTIAEVRNSQRAASQQFRDTRVMLPNPNVSAPLDRVDPQSYRDEIQDLGLAPDSVKHFWQLERGDAGAGGSSYRRIETFQLLAATGDRVAFTPYSKAVEIATYRSSDQRPRNLQVSMFSYGRQVESAVPLEPLPEYDISKYASGIPAGTPSVVQYSPGIPQFSTTQFRVMIFDESGQRFVDVDVLGVRSMDFYAYGATVFALIKEDGYVIDRQTETNAALGPGLIDQGTVSARILPLRLNETKNVNKRTVTMRTPSGASVSIVLIPPGAISVQGITSPTVPPATVSVTFATVDPLATGAAAVNGLLGQIAFPTTQSAVQLIPNANAILIITAAGNPSFRSWSFVFDVTS